jgi:uracil-DNA glycosylase
MSGPAAARYAAPGSGWPGDPATPQTPVAHSAAEVSELAAAAGTLHELSARQSVCRACPRLVAWREQVAVQKRRSYAAEPYWGRPIPGWGDDRPGLLIVGLAPAAHGGNRTGRIFTGDRSGDVLFESLYRCGFAAQPHSVAADDGQRLIGARVAAAVRCAPPANKPTPAERDTCAPWLAAELGLALSASPDRRPAASASPDRRPAASASPDTGPVAATPEARPAAASLRVIVCLGGFAWQALWPALSAAGFTVPRPRPSFGHGAEVVLAGGPGRAARGPGERSVLLIGCYHPSQQNTFTGRVTPAMLDAVFTRARQECEISET